MSSPQGDQGLNLLCHDHPLDHRIRSEARVGETHFWSIATFERILFLWEEGLLNVLGSMEGTVNVVTLYYQEGPTIIMHTD